MSGFDITAEAISAKVDEIKGIVAEASAVRGNAAKMLADATVEALAVDVTLPAGDIPAMAKGSVKIEKTDDGPVATFALGDLAIFAKRLHEWADQVCQETVSGILTAKSTGVSVDVLRTRYDNAVKFLDAMLTVAPAMGVVEDEAAATKIRESVPAFGKGGARKNGASPSPRKAGTSFAKFYRIGTDGVKRYQGDTQHSVSSLAWYHGADLVGKPKQGDKNDGRGVSVDEVTKVLNEAGVASPAGKPWEFKSASGVTYGMETADTSDQPDDVAKEEE